MYDHTTGEFIRKPYIRPIFVRPKVGRVRIHIDTLTFDLEAEEAMSVANELVDTAERVVRHEAQ